MKAIRRLFLFLIVVSFAVGSTDAQVPNTGANPWEEDIREFERADSLHPPPRGGFLFVGSSSIRMWETVREDFPDLQVINRGFGGSELSDALYFADRIILPYKPRMIIVYAGDNDLANGKQAEVVCSDYKSLVRSIHTNLPTTRIAYISIKPSLARWNLVDKIRKTNRLIKEYSAQDRQLAYIDIFTPMLGKDGTPRKELLAPDGLHLNREGYALWRKVVRPFLQ